MLLMTVRLGAVLPCPKSQFRAPGLDVLVCGSEVQEEVEFESGLCAFDCLTEFPGEQIK